MSRTMRLLGAASVLLLPVLAAGAGEDGGCEHAGHHAAAAHAAHGDHHEHDEHHGVVEVGEPVPTLQIEVTRDAMSGWNLQLTTTHFRFAPEAASGPHRAGEGHAHVYVDGRKLARLYGPWFHIPELGPGRHQISVSLNANDHRVYVRETRAIEAVAEVDD